MIAVLFFFCVCGERASYVAYFLICRSSGKHYHHLLNFFALFVWIGVIVQFSGTIPNSLSVDSFCCCRQYFRRLVFGDCRVFFLLDCQTVVLNDYRGLCFRQRLLANPSSTSLLTLCRFQTDSIAHLRN